MQKSKFNFLLLGVLSLFLWNCRGDQGPVGPQGNPGPPGPTGPAAPLALMYEIEFDLNAANEWKIVYPFPEEDEIYPEDVVLVYLLWDQVTADDGSSVDVWRLMPITYFQQRGILTMNSDFAFGDISIYLEASFPLDAQSDMNDLVARIVVVPAEQSPNQRIGAPVNFQNYEEVKAAYGLKETGPAKGKPFLRIIKDLEK